MISAHGRSIQEAREGGVRSGEHAARVSLIAAQLGAALCLLYAFEIETRTFFGVMLLAFTGVMVNLAVPRPMRLQVFAVVSVASVAIAIGFDAASVVVAIGSVIIVVCHLPLALRWRVGLLLIVAAALALLRTGSGPPGIPEAAVPVVASMFMFRTAMYLHALEHQAAPTSPSLGLSYFFMLPNASFTLFPVVDYQSFVRTRYDAEEFSIYEQGIRWVFRGLLHLIAYRLVASRFVVADTWANDLGSIALYILTTFLLYLQVSGSFHLIVGLLHLFGFRLPATHHLYFLSTGFADFWRRINIYWKDFMVKLVFYPGFFRFRRHGEAFALMASTMLVFVVTWLLHAYQQYWLEGVVVMRWRDAVFWLLFGILVVFATLRERRTARRPEGSTGRWSVQKASATTLTFLCIAVLWSFWSADSLDTWVYMWRHVWRTSANQVLLIAAAVATLFFIAGSRWGAPRLVTLSSVPEPLSRVARRSIARVGGALLLCIPTIPSVTGHLPPPATTLVRGAQGRTPPGWQLGAHLGGYYQQLEARRVNLSTRPWRLVPAHDRWDVEVLESQTTDFYLANLRPGNFATANGTTVTINSRGMRDREFELRKPPNTLRIAIIGPSDLMGWGVADHETMDTWLEGALDSAAAPMGLRVEVLNFSRPAWTLAQEAYAVTGLAAPFSPDLVLLAVHPLELYPLAIAARKWLERDAALPDSTMADLISRAGLKPEMTVEAAVPRLRLIEAEWSRHVAMQAARNASAANARVAALILRLPDWRGAPTLIPILRGLESAGIPRLDCWDAYAAHDAATVWLNSYDHHPNALGHRLLAQCVFDQLRASPSLFPIWPPAPTAAVP